MDYKLKQEKVKEINALLAETELAEFNIWHCNADLGKHLYLIKESFDGSTKEFGHWLNQNTPKLDVKLVSYYIKLAGYNDDQHSADTIFDWMVDNAIKATNPRSCWDKFNKAHKSEPTPDETNSEVETTTPDAPTTKDSLVSRLSQLYDEFTKRAVDLNDDELDTIDTISQQFSEYIETIVA